MSALSTAMNWRRPWQIGSLGSRIQVFGNRVGLWPIWRLGLINRPLSSLSIYYQSQPSTLGHSVHLTCCRCGPGLVSLIHSPLDNHPTNKPRLVPHVCLVISITGQIRKISISFSWRKTSCLSVIHSNTGECMLFRKITELKNFSMLTVRIQKHN